MKIGVWELMVVFVVALLVIGPDKLPEYAKKLGEALGQFKKYSSEATKEIRESVVEPLQEAQRPLREAMEPINDLEKSVRGEMNDIKKSFEEIGKMTPDQQDEKEADEDGEDGQGAESAGSMQSGSDLEDTDTAQAGDTDTAQAGETDPPAAPAAGNEADDEIRTSAADKETEDA